MDLSYFQKINNIYDSKSKQETDLYLLNRYVNETFTDTIDYHTVKKNDKPFELLIIKDTDGNTFKKKIKSRPNEYFNLGDYIEWNGQYWIVTLIDTDDKTYNSGYMYLCTVALRWQNLNGKIIERWAYSEDFTKYSSGVAGNNVLTVGDNQYGLTIPIDEETKYLKRDIRFPIDLDDAEEPDIYILTNKKVYLNNNQYFGRGGNMQLTLAFDSYNKNKDTLVTLEDGRKVWICDYHSPTSPIPPIDPIPPIETPILSATISGSNNLKVGFERTYSVKFTDKDGSQVDDVDFEWKIVSEFDSKINRTISGNAIRIKIDDDSLSDESFLLQVTVDSEIIGEIVINIEEGF